LKASAQGARPPSLEGRRNLPAARESNTNRSIKMRVYEPDKREAIIHEVLKELYILRQAIDHQSGSPDARMKMVTKIRSKLKDMIEPESESR
tara:strand:- start:54 stop:329 length:276 start_codon:yes stop_codon:yes gene_type:complete